MGLHGYIEMSWRCTWASGICAWHLTLCGVQGGVRGRCSRRKAAVMQQCAPLVEVPAGVSPVAVPQAALAAPPPSEVLLGAQHEVASGATKREELRLLTAELSQDTQRNDTMLSILAGAASDSPQSKPGVPEGRLTSGGHGAVAGGGGSRASSARRASPGKRHRIAQAYAQLQAKAQASGCPTPPEHSALSLQITEQGVASIPCPLSCPVIIEQGAAQQASQGYAEGKALKTSEGSLLGGLRRKYNKPWLRNAKLKLAQEGGPSRGAPKSTGTGGVLSPNESLGAVLQARGSVGAHASPSRGSSKPSAALSVGESNFAAQRGPTSAEVFTELEAEHNACVGALIEAEMATSTRDAKKPAHTHRTRPTSNRT